MSSTIVKPASLTIPGGISPAASAATTASSSMTSSTPRVPETATQRTSTPRPRRPPQAQTRPDHRHHPRVQNCPVASTSTLAERYVRHPKRSYRSSGTPTAPSPSDALEGHTASTSTLAERYVRHPKRSYRSSGTPTAPSPSDALEGDTASTSTLADRHLRHPKRSYRSSGTPTAPSPSDALEGDTASTSTLAGGYLRHPRHLRRPSGTTSPTPMSGVVYLHTAASLGAGPIWQNTDSWLWGEVNRVLEEHPLRGFSWQPSNASKGNIPSRGGPARVDPGQARPFVPRLQPQCHRPTRMHVCPNPGAFKSDSQENTEDHATP